MALQDPVQHVVYLHGFASSPASSKATRFATELAARGVGFSCPDLNLPSFDTLTVTRMLGQTRAAIESARGPVALVGSSLGGFVALHAAARDRTGKVDRLVLMAPALDFGGNRLRQLREAGIDEWRRSGRLSVYHYGARENRDIGFELYEDGAQYDAFDVHLTLPMLVFQGRLDDTVEPAMVEDWARGAGNIDLRLLDDDHLLTASIDLVWRESEKFLAVPTTLSAPQA